MIRPVETVSESISQWFWAQDFDDVLYELDIDGLRRGHTFAAVEYDKAARVIMLNHIPAHDVLEFWPAHGPLEYIRFRREVSAPKKASEEIIYELQLIDGALQITREMGEDTEPEQVALAVFPIVKLQYSENQFRPFFMALAQLERAYFEGRSLQQHALTFSRFEILWTNATLGDTVTLSGIGPRSLIKLGEPGTSLNALQGGGAGIEAGRVDLQELTEKMTLLSARPLQADGIRSATEVNVSSGQQDAPIRRLADMRINAVREIVRIAGEWMSATGLGSVDTGNLEQYDVSGKNDFTPLVAGNADAQMLLNALAVGAIDSATFRRGFVEAIPSLRGVDPDDIADRVGGGDGMDRYLTPYAPPL